MKIKDKDVRKIAEVAMEQGWDVRRRQSGRQHLEFRPPDKSQAVVIFSTTSSDWRATRNLRAQLRRSGLQIQ